MIKRTIFYVMFLLLVVAGASFSAPGSGVVIGGKNTGPQSRILTANYAILSSTSDALSNPNISQFQNDANYVTPNYFFGVSVNGIISANNFVGSGAGLTGLAGYLTTVNADARYVSFNGTAAAGNISVNGTISANTFVGSYKGTWSGSAIGLGYMNSAVITNNYTGGVSINGTISASASVINGPTAYMVITQVGNYSAGNECVILVNATPTTITLPAANTVQGRVYYVKKIDVGGAGKTMTVATAGGNIDGAATKATTTRYTTYQIISDGANWWIM